MSLFFSGLLCHLIFCPQTAIDDLSPHGPWAFRLRLQHASAFLGPQLADGRTAGSTPVPELSSLPLFVFPWRASPGNPEPLPGSSQSGESHLVTPCTHTSLFPLLPVTSNNVPVREAHSPRTWKVCSAVWNQDTEHLQIIHAPHILPQHVHTLTHPLTHHQTRTHIHTHLHTQGCPVATSTDFLPWAVYTLPAQIQR